MKPGKKHHGKRAVNFPNQRGLTDRQYALLDALLNGGQLMLATHWKVRKGKRERDNGWYLYQGGTTTRVNDNTVWTLRDRGLIEKKDFYTIGQQGQFKLRDEQEVRAKAAFRIAEPILPPAVPKTFKRMALRT